MDPDILTLNLHHFCVPAIYDTEVKDLCKHCSFPTIVSDSLLSSGFTFDPFKILSFGKKVKESGQPRP